MSEPIEIDGRRIGAGAPCFVVAEIGINHNGELALARSMLAAAAAAGADAVKFQSYRTEDFLGDRRATHGYWSSGREVLEPQYDLFKRCELSRESLLELRTLAARLGVVFFSTPTSPAGVEELRAAGVGLLKNGSDYLGDLRLVRAMAASGLPSVLSTGMATLAEIDEAVRAFREAGGRELVLLHCTSCYPTAATDVHLRKIPVLAAAFGCPAGLSDHSFGPVAALGAVALGACLLEKHFTLDHDLSGPDQRFSADPAEFSGLVRSVRELEQCLGRSAIGPTAAERESRAAFRLSCVARTALDEGALLRDEHIAFRRPGTGLPPASVAWLTGRRLARAVAAGAPLRMEDVA